MQLRRLCQLMEPEPGNALEAEGVLNPAAVRGPDGKLYIFPRMVAKGNFSRIGIARLRFSEAGEPCGVERMGIVLEPTTEYECRADGSGGCEDPRVTYVENLGHYVMTYTALSPKGPRIALATSEDLFHWKRLGLATFEPYEGIEFDGVDNKDASVFPTAVPDPSGKPALALLHRPLFAGTRPEEKAKDSAVPVRDLRRESIWIAYRDMDANCGSPASLCRFTSHHCLASPRQPWEMLKIGCGPPPILTRHGWLMIYHGVSQLDKATASGRKLSYAAGLMILAKADPRKILYRSHDPVLTPELPAERDGIITNVVFPTGIDRRDDIGAPDRFDVYYGMADDRIGVARLDLPEQLP